MLCLARYCLLNFLPCVLHSYLFKRTTCSKLEWLLKYGERYLVPERRSGSFLLSTKISKVHYEPKGVVAAIVSWNYRMPTFGAEKLTHVL